VTRTAIEANRDQSQKVHGHVVERVQNREVEDGHDHDHVVGGQNHVVGDVHAYNAGGVGVYVPVGGPGHVLGGGLDSVEGGARARLARGVLVRDVGENLVQEVGKRSVQKARDDPGPMVEEETDHEGKNDHGREIGVALDRKKRNVFESKRARHQGNVHILVVHHPRTKDVHVIVGRDVRDQEAVGDQVSKSSLIPQRGVIRREPPKLEASQGVPLIQGIILRIGRK